MGYDEPEPEAERCAPRAWVVTPATPLHAEIKTPPSVTDVERFARTASTWASLVFG